MTARRIASVLALLAASVAFMSCAHGAHGTLAEWNAAPDVTDSTLALWHLDEPTGLTITDAGAAHRDGILGLDTKAAFGRFHGARQFVSSINSWAIVPVERAPVLRDTWTIQVWIHPDAYGPFECSVIASRWTDQPAEQSWMLGLTGYDRTLIAGAPAPPGTFADLFARHEVGLLLFAYQPQDAGASRAYTSTLPIELDRWTSIAVTCDGAALRMYVDGRLDAQFAVPVRPRDVPAPLVIGNLIDPRWLTESQGSTRVPDDGNHYPFYAFEGSIDELQVTAGVHAH